MTVDPALVEAANKAVEAGRADSLSGWVNLALAERAEKEQRLQVLAKAIAGYEEEFGEISAEELKQQARLDERSAVVVRGRPRAPARRRGKGPA